MITKRRKQAGLFRLFPQPAVVPDRLTQGTRRHPPWKVQGRANSYRPRSTERNTLHLATSCYILNTLQSRMTHGRNEKGVPHCTNSANPRRRSSGVRRCSNANKIRRAAHSSPALDAPKNELLEDRNKGRSEVEDVHLDMHTHRRQWCSSNDALERWTDSRHSFDGDRSPGVSLSPRRETQKC